MFARSIPAGPKRAFQPRAAAPYLPVIPVEAGIFWRGGRLHSSPDEALASPGATVFGRAPASAGSVRLETGK
jgi:hypothetical protein